jgi:hypothetical protein
MEQGCTKKVLGGGGWDILCVSLYRFSRKPYKLRSICRSRCYSQLLWHLAVISKSYKSGGLGWMCCPLRTISQKGNDSVGIGFKPCHVQRWAECENWQLFWRAGRHYSWTDRCSLPSRKRLFFYSFVKQICNRANKPVVMSRRDLCITLILRTRHCMLNENSVYVRFVSFPLSLTLPREVEIRPF